MPEHKIPQPGDAALGMHTAMPRRDFLGSTLLASGALLMQSMTPAELLAAQDDFTGYSHNPPASTPSAVSGSASTHRKSLREKSPLASLTLLTLL